MLRFGNSGERRGPVRCPACGSTGHVSLVLTAGASGGTFDLLRCPACEARFFDPLPQLDYSEHTASSYSIRHYVEIGAGISTFYEVLFRYITPGFAGRMLDVGCGYGFSLDVVETLTAGSAVGVEPSLYGEVGARELGVTIHRGYAADLDQLAGETFDVVFSSEVLEHVGDPNAFLALLRGWLQPDGILILTTPNAEVIAPGRLPDASLLPILSVGAHTILYTPSALENILRRNGFADVKVIDRGAGLYCYASPGRFTLQAEPPLEGLLRYFHGKLEDPNLAPSARAGIVYRLFRDCVNTGRYREADALAEALELPTHAEIERIGTEPELAAAMPYCTPCFAYYRGMLELNHRGDYARAAEILALARALLALKLRLLPDASPEEESLLEPARAHQSLALDLARKRRRAVLMAWLHRLPPPVRRALRPVRKLADRTRSILHRRS